jgi:hypothetical protein
VDAVRDVLARPAKLCLEGLSASAAKAHVRSRVLGGASSQVDFDAWEWSQWRRRCRLPGHDADELLGTQHWLSRVFFLG